MCELFGMSASQPVTAGMALERLRQRGGREADNPDGWGLAWREGGGFEIRKRPAPAWRSRQFARLCSETRSDLILAHVRKARHPPVRTLANTHPFRRRCCGREWIFAHNGLVPEIVEIERGSLNPVCRPTGETDSEFAFCHLLGHIARHFDSHEDANPLPGIEGLAMVSNLIVSFGKFNFLMSDGERLIAYGHDRLHYLDRCNYRGMGGNRESLAMVATEPLDADDPWIPFEPGELRIYHHGLLQDSSAIPWTSPDS
ncbi:MAG: class II glutamine amidotransferase [Rhodocyclaceae bacterium]